MKLLLRALLVPMFTLLLAAPALAQTPPEPTSQPASQPTSQPTSQPAPKPDNKGASKDKKQDGSTLSKEEKEQLEALGYVEE